MMRKYRPKQSPGRPRGDQRGATLLHNHARGRRRDLFVAVTATFLLLYVFGVIERGSRRLVRVDHDRDSIFVRSLDESIGILGLTELRTPPHPGGSLQRRTPHMALGPDVPDPPLVVVPAATPRTRHRIGERFSVRARSVLAFAS